MRHNALLLMVLLVGCGEVNIDKDASTVLDGAIADDGGSIIDSGAVDAVVFDADDGSCNADQFCLGDAPVGWTGPLAIGGGSCPGDYPTADGTVHENLSAAAASCSCGCVVNNVSCELRANGNVYVPQGSCDSPNPDDALLTATVAASCKTNPSETIPTATWGVTDSVCDGATAGASCNGGTCYAGASSFGSLCIIQDGDLACPAGSNYTERTLYHRAFDDTRSCSACGCSPSGQRCELDLEICSVGFFDITLKSAESGSSYRLNPSDGDSVSLQASRITSDGSCASSGGAATGSATPSMPVTACCRP